LNEKNELVVGHELYKRLGKSVKERCESYRALFNIEVPQKTIVEIREATISHGYWEANTLKKKLQIRLIDP